MKRTALSCALLLTLLCSLLANLASCAASDPVLYSITEGSRVYEVCGKGSTASSVRVTENGSEVWSKRIRVKKSVGDRGGSYGFAVMDFNFDGYADFKLAVSAEGDCLTERIFLQDPQTGSYRESDLFEGLTTVGVKPDQKAILSFSHAERKDGDYEGSGGILYTTTDTTTGYVWKDGILVPYRRISLTYFSERDVYIYAVSDYNEESGEFYSPDEKRLYPDEYKQQDFSFLYYFR